MKSKLFNKIMTSLLAVVTLFSMIPSVLVPVNAGDFNDDATGGGSSHGITSSDYSWTIYKQGYRFSIVDQNGNLMGRPVDIIFSNIPSNALCIWTNKLENFNRRTTPNLVINVNELLSDSNFSGAGDMPKPMRWSGGPIGQGDELRDWLIKGTVFDHSSSPYNPSYPSGGHYPSGGNHSDNSSNTDKTPSGTESHEHVPTRKEKENSVARKVGNEMAKSISKQANIYIKDYGYNPKECISGLDYYVNSLLIPGVWKRKDLNYDQKSIIVKILRDNLTKVQNNIRTHPEKWVKKKVEIRPSLGLFAPVYAAETEKKGYLQAVLGYKKNGQYIFQLYDTAIDKDMVNTIAVNGFGIIVEPIIWVNPLASHKSKWVYGTITNISQWAKDLEARGSKEPLSWDGNGNAMINDYWSVCNKTGPISLCLEKGLNLGSHNMSAPNMNKCPVNIYDMSDTSVGYAMHYYYPNAKDSSDTKTYDKKETGPHKAPDPLKIKLAPGEDEKTSRVFNIVKTYVEYDEEIPNTEYLIGTYSRKQNPGQIAIMNEPEYYVTDYITSANYIETDINTEWSEIVNGVKASKSKHYGNDNAEKTGTIANETLKDPVNTLYVKLVKRNPIKDPEDLSIRNEIYESQLIKSIATVNELEGTNWGDYAFNAHVDAAKTSHEYEKWITSGYWTNTANEDGTTSKHWVDTSHYETRNCTGMSRLNGDNSVYATWKGLHTPVSLESKSNVLVHPNFNSILVSGSEKSDSITKTDGAVGDGAKDWTISSDYKSDKGIGYFTTIWRGPYDPDVTLAGYKKGSMSDESWNSVSTMFPTGNTPAGNRMTESVKVYPGVSLVLGISDKDTTVISKCPTHKESDFKDQVLSTSTGDEDQVKFNGDFDVHAYAGEEKTTAHAEIKDINGLSMSIMGNGTTKTSLYTKDCGSVLSYYPYIRMSFMNTADGYEEAGWNEIRYGGLKIGTPEQQKYLKDRTVFVLSDKKSSILPSNSVEVGWFNDATADKTPMKMQSQQWTTHVKGDGSQKWQQSNLVLPGGAMFNLNTKGSNICVKANTFSTYVDDASRSWIEVDPSEYTAESIIKNNDEFLTEFRNNIDNLRVVQWVNKNNTLNNAWDNTSTAVKIRDGGEDLSHLGLGNRASTDSKYGMITGSNGPDAARRGDLDIVREGYQTTLYKVFTDTEGNIYIAETSNDMSNKKIDAALLSELEQRLHNVNGTNLSNTTNVKITRLGNKNSGLKAILNGLKNGKKVNYLYTLDLRTGVISNVVNSVTRNKGDDDTNAWVSDGHWYNEAFDGVYVVEQSATLQIGLNVPNTRIGVLDPNLCPANNSGMSGLFSNAFISQFRLDNKCDTPDALNKPDGYVGTFDGMMVKMPDMENIVYTRPFYIPNVNVQDLTN